MTSTELRNAIAEIEQAYERDGTPCRAYLTTVGRAEDGRSMWQAYFAVDGGRKRLPVGPVGTWSQAARVARALNERSGLQTERER